ncbi:MAG: DALR domain-containing protein, partial [Phycisphaeraceae bacterium]
SEEALESAQGGWERLYNAVRLTRQMMNSAPEGDDGNGFNERIEQARTGFQAVMDDDFNAPKALGILCGRRRPGEPLRSAARGVAGEGGWGSCSAFTPHATTK